MKLDRLLRALPSYTISHQRDVDIAGITSDSRKVNPGSLFVAVRGLERDGTNFVPDAVARGAAAVLAERRVREDLPEAVPLVIVPDSRSALAHLAAAWNNYPSRNVRVIGVTGTDGKTTTSTLIGNILLSAGHSVGTVTTVAAHIGGEEIDTGFHTTTPDAPEIQRYLAQMVEKGAEYAVVEATSHGLAQGRLDAVDFDVAVITNLTHEHLDFHGTWENYRDAKALLFRALMTTRRKPRTAKVAVLNADDNARGVFDYLRAIEADARVIYSLQQPPVGDRPEQGRGQGSASREAIDSSQATEHWIYGRDIVHSTAGLQFTISTQFGELSISSPLIGRYNVSNILAAVGAGIARRLPFDAIATGVRMTRGIVGRMERIYPMAGSGKNPDINVIVDFAHTPNALEMALETARELTTERVIVVFGCAGLRDVQKRSWMGSIAGRLADLTVVTAEDPRTESLDEINAEIARGLEEAARRRDQDFFIVNDRAQAIAFAIEVARAGDLVLVTGKGHERSMCFGTTEYPWSDQEAVRKALDLRAERTG